MMDIIETVYHTNEIAQMKQRDKALSMNDAKYAIIKAMRFKEHGINWVKNHWPELVGLSILLIVVLYYAIFNHSIQLFDYDMIEQNVHFLLRGYNLIHTPGVTWWDWNLFLGSSTFSYVYYFLFSPFWLTYALLPSKEWIPYAFIYISFLKYGLLFIFSSLYFRKIRSTNIAVFAGSLMLTFSGFAMGYYNYNHFIDVYLFVPLVLNFIESYIDQKKRLGLILSISTMAIINGYLLYLFTIYFFIYFSFRTLSLNRLNVSLFIKKLALFFAHYLLAIGIGSIGFIPGILSMLGTSRLSLDTHFFTLISLNDAFRYITAFFQPIVDRTNFNPLINANIVPSYGWSGGAAVYSFIITPMFAWMYFGLQKSRKEKLVVLSVLLGLVSLSLFPNLYFFLQGNKDTRWMIMFTLLFSYMVSDVLDDVHSIKHKSMLISGLMTSLVLVGSYYLSKFLNVQNNLVYYAIAKRNVLILGSIVLFYYGLVVWMKNKQLKTLLLVFALSFESLFILYNIFLNPVSSISMTYAKSLKYELTSTELIDAIKQSDSSTYRIDGIVNGGYNDPVSKDYMGFTFYSSVYNYNVDPYIQGNIASAGGWVVGGNSGKPLFKNLFGAKYWFDDSEFYLNAPYGYVYDQTVKLSNRKIDVFENAFPIPLARVVNQTVAYDTWSQLSALNKTRTIMNSVVLENSTNTNLTYIDNIIKLADFSNHYEMVFDEVQINANLIVETPRSDEVKMSIYLDDKLVDKHYSYEPQYTSLYISKPFNRVVYEVTNLYSVPESEFINTASIEFPEAYYPEWYAQNQNNFITDLKLDQNTFSGSIQLDSKQWVVTSIAYDRNWTLRVDGKEIEIINVNGGFIGFELEAGKHNFKGNYFPSLLIPSALISFFSILILVYLQFKTKLKKL